MWYTILFLNLLLLPQLIFGQSTQFRKITVANGLSNNFVSTIYKDQSGFIWFGTMEGLDRFDGQEIRSFSGRFPDGQQRVNTIADDPVNGFWIGTDKGLFFWDFVSAEFEQVPLSGKNPKVTTLLTLPGYSTLLAGTSDGIFLINTSTRKMIKLDVLPDAPFVTTGAVYDGKGKAWISTSVCLIELEVNDGTTTIHNNELTGSFYNNFSSITLMDGEILVSTVSRGLYLFDHRTGVFRPYQNFGSVFILTLNYNSRGTLYIGTDGNGLLELNTSTGAISSYTQDINNPGSLSSNAVYSILIEENGRKWIGTYIGGVNFTNTESSYFKVFTESEKLGENSIRSLYFAKDEKKFIGTREGLFIVEKNGQTREFNIGNNNQLRSNVILSFGSFDESILLGTFRGGITRYNKTSNQLESYRNVQAFSTGSVYGFTHDQDGNLFIGSMEGLFRIEAATGAIDQFSVGNSALMDNRIISILFDSQGRLWLGSVAGSSVYTFDDLQLVRLETSYDLSEIKAVSFFEDHQGNIWMATEGNGLCVVSSDMNHISYFTTQDGLSNNSVTSVTEAPENILWIGTLRGLSRFDKSSGRFFSFSLSDGLPSLVFNRGAVINNYHSDGKLWFGSERGLISFYPDSLSTTSAHERVILTDFFLSGHRAEPSPESFLNRPVNEMEKIVVRPGHGSIGFRVIALNFYNPGDNKYAYRLRGKDENWQFTNENYITFPELKPGKYTFDVHLSRGVHADQSDITSINIIVKPYFYQSVAFRFLMILLATAIVAGLYFARNYLLKLKSKRQRKGDPSRYETSHLSESRRNEIESLLISYVEKNKPYLNPDLKLSDLAEAIDCPMHDVSQVINQNLNKSYHDFINYYRINAVKECLSDPSFERYTLLAIGQHCGFNSKTSFYRAFKKLTGKTPYDYHMQIQKAADKA